MYGYVMEGQAGSMDCRQILGMWFWRLTLPVGGSFLGLRRRRWWRKLQSAGVRCAVLPDHLAAEGVRWGIEPVEVYSLRRAMLPQILDRCPSLSGKSVRLAAPYVTAAVGAAAEVLARRARYVDLQVGRGGEALALHLQREFGLAVGAVGTVALTVDFGSGSLGRCIYLGEDCAARQQVVYHVEKLASVGIEVQEQLLSALFGAGYLEKEEIQVKTILFNA